MKDSAAVISAICSKRLGDCLGMAGAGLFFIAVASRSDAPEAFAAVGVAMIALGVPLSFLGVRDRIRTAK